MKALSAAADSLLADYVRVQQPLMDMPSRLHEESGKRRKYAAQQGDQVAAKVTRTDENGSWILAYV